MRTLIFDLFSDLGHFKKYYTTSSPLTFSFPPPPTIKGMLGAILGIDKKKYLSVFSDEKCHIAVQIISPIKKIRLGLNHINTKGNYWIPAKKGAHEARTQIRTEFLKNPAYRIYVAHSDEEIFKNLAKNLQEHKTFYTLSMGLSELIADFNYLGTEEFIPNKDRRANIKTVVPVTFIKENGIFFEAGKKYFKEKVPVSMTSERVVNKYIDIIFENQGETIVAETNKIWEDKNGNQITFF